MCHSVYVSFLSGFFFFLVTVRVAESLQFVIILCTTILSSGWKTCIIFMVIEGVLILFNLGLSFIVTYLEIYIVVSIFRQGALIAGYCTMLGNDLTLSLPKTVANWLKASCTGFLKR